MVFTKRLYQNLGLGIVLLFLVLFPFGQLLKLQVILLGREIFIPLVDIITLICLPYLFVNSLKTPKIFKLFLNSLIVVLFSTVVSIAYFSISEVLIGSVYLLRLFSYLAFFILVRSLINEKRIMKDVLFDSLIVVSIFAAIFGWIQYLWVSDLTSLKYIGWDDHLGRLVGTFLDPGFTGVILVLGSILSLVKFSDGFDRKYLWLSLFLALSTAFTYSRASYLALIAGTLVVLKFTRKWRYIFIIFIFLTITPFLPRPKSEGVRLERTRSVILRFENYRETLEIIKKYPLLGVGYNNLCAARIKIFGGDSKSHACGGSDSSLLFVLATTGVVGFLVFSNLGFKIFETLDDSLYSLSFKSSALSLLVHSLFVHSLFYPHVLGFIAILLAMSIKE